MFQIALIAFVAKKIGTDRLKGAFRVTAYAAGVSVLCGGIGIHKARAAMNEKGLEFGENMASLASMMQDPHTFRLNGQVIHTSMGTSLQGVTGVLDKYEANCKAALGGDAVVWDGLPDTNGTPPKEHKLVVAPILRKEVGPKGMVACFVPTDPAAPHSERALDSALHDFNETGNLSAIGNLRYAYVKESPTGSTVFTVWTDGEFNLKAFVPAPGTDAGGTDPVIMTRPQDATRMFTGSVDGVPYRVYGYQTSQSPADAIHSYDAAMINKGWLSVANPIFEGMPHEGSEGRSYISPDKGFAGVVSAIKSSNGETMVGVAEVTDGTIHPPTAEAKESDGF